jgi:hypothetical protein
MKNTLLAATAYGAFAALMILSPVGGPISPTFAATPNMLTSTGSHAYDCDIEKTDPPFPQAGKAHVIIDGKTQRVTVALRDLADGDGKQVPGATQSFPLAIHFEDAGYLTTAWDLDKTGGARGLLDYFADRDPKLQLVTTIPTADWPGWVPPISNPAAYYGAFACHEAK